MPTVGTAAGHTGPSTVVTVAADAAAVAGKAFAM